MDVLLCWSKERSRMMASELREWLPKVLPAVRPWMSDSDITKGKDWFDELHNFLGEAKAVIVCITPENARSPWIYYECGQVAGRATSNLICPFLLENESSILSDGPLGRMQHTKAEKEDAFLLLRTLNKNLQDRALKEALLETNFEREWSAIAGTLARIRRIEVDAGGTETTIATDADLFAGANLSSEERTIVLEIGQDKDGDIHAYVTSGGDHFQTNGKDLNGNGDARSTARWRQALRSLVRLGILEMRGRKGETFALTDKGFRLYDMLKDAQ